MQEKTCKCGGTISFVQEYEDFAKLYHCNKCRKFELEFKECNHDFATFKIRWGEDSIHVVTKCQICGRHGKTHKKSHFNLDELQFFDETIETSYHERLMKAREEFSKTHERIVIEQKKANNSWNIEQWYYGYLESEMWRRKREFILKRSNGKCERCGKKANYVHHKTYERVGYEQPEDLMAVCKSCHGLEHSENPGLTIVEQFRLHDL